MSEPSRPEPSPVPGTTSSRSTSTNDTSSKYVDFFLYASAALTYVPLAIYNKWLLDWIVGPFWLVAWVWGLPALVRLVRHQPVRPQRGRSDAAP